MFTKCSLSVLHLALQCYHQEGKKFEKGSYKCECKQGFEYPFNDRAWYFSGQAMEEEYRKKVEGQPTRSVLHLVSSKQTAASAI